MSEQKVLLAGEFISVTEINGYTETISKEKRVMLVLLKAKEPMWLQDFGKQCQTSRRYISKVLSDLFKKGLVYRLRSSNRMYYVLTEKGYNEVREEK